MMIAHGGAHLAAGLLFTIAAWTDFFDGYIARRFGLMSQFGKLVDPIADRLLVNSAAILLSIYDDRLLGIEFIVVVARDIIGTWGYMQLRHYVIPDVSRLGKWGMFLMMFGLGWLLMLPSHTWPVWFFWTGLVVSIAVRGQYVWRYGWALPGRSHTGHVPRATNSASQTGSQLAVHDDENDVYSSPPHGAPDVAVSGEDSSGSTS